MADPFTGGQTSRASNALQKRQESLKRWTTSETAKESSDRTRKKTKIQFSLGTVFLSAVSSGDVEEVKRLLAKGADINHQNVDGLTALHQACIDESYDLVKFLVDHGARLDIRDNEGWSALHAAASCGSVEIAQCLLDHGADVAAVNNEGELPLDLAEEEDMEDLLTDEIERLGIDVELARSIEERIMLEDAQSWMNGRSINETKDKSGATSLHVAASKGYLQVISLLLQLGVDINAKDVDGWTPLHAAVHWGQNDACEVLAEHGANFSAKNKMGSTPIDLAEPDMVKMLEELKKRQNDKPKINASTTPVIKSNMESGPAPLKRRPSKTSQARMLRTLPPANNPGVLYMKSSITRIKDQNLFLRDINQERAQMEASMEQISPKSKPSRPPSFSDSPKEDKENEREKRDGFSKEDSGTESDTEESSEEDSEDDSEEDKESAKPSVNSVAPKANVTVNSVPSKPTVNSLKKPEDESDSEEETGSETEESSEEEEEEPVKPDTRTSTTSSVRAPLTTRAPSTPLSPTKVGVGSTSKLLKSPFLDNDKRANAPSSPVSKTEPSRTSRFTSKEESKDDTKSRFGSYPTRTTAATTSNTTSTITTGTRGRINSTPSEDSQTRTTRAKKVTKRAATSYVGSTGSRGDEGENEEEEDRKSNDISHRKADGDDERKDTSSQRSSREETSSASSRPYSGTDSFLSRRNRLSGTADDRSEQDGRSRQQAGTNKESEEALPAWKRRLKEKEREREREKEKEKEEKEREKEREREREKQREKEKAESEMPSYRRSRLADREKEKEKEKEEKEKEEDDSSMSTAARVRRARRLREKRRGGSDDDEAEDVRKNESDEKAPVGSRRRSQETRHEDAKSVTDRIRAGRTSDSKGSLGTSKVNATTITDADPQKLKERLQEAQLELQEYKIKLEKALQAKEELERKYANVEEDIKQLSDLKADNQRLKDENGALIRVISKLSRPST